MTASEKSLFNGCTQTHTLATNTERFATTFSYVFKGKNQPKVSTSTNSKEKPQKVLITPFEGNDEKAQYASFKHIFI